MTPEAQTTAIAESMGWKWIQTNFEAKSGLIGTDSLHSGNIPYQGRNYPSNAHLPTYGKVIPYYLNDLNAMHKVEFSTFKTGSEWSKYYVNLGKVCREGDEENCNSPFSATAAQRAKAYLKTLNLWIYD